jgi:hypothetical protein
MNVRLHIDRLVLDGVAVRAGDRARLQAAVEAELTRLVQGGGIAPELARGGGLPSLAAPQITVAPRATAAQLGTSIAGAVYGSIGGRR